MPTMIANGRASTAAVRARGRCVRRLRGRVSAVVASSRCLVHRLRARRVTIVVVRAVITNCWASVVGTTADRGAIPSLTGREMRVGAWLTDAADAVRNIVRNAPTAVVIARAVPETVVTVTPV